MRSLDRILWSYSAQFCAGHVFWDDPGLSADLEGAREYQDGEGS